MVRIDKYLWATRLCKTRSMATNLVKSGQILINDIQVKPAAEIKIGDTITIKKNTAKFTYEIKDLLEKRVGAKLVENYLADTTTEEEKEKYRVYQLAQKEYRYFGLGRPTKKQRRDMKKFKGD